MKHQLTAKRKVDMSYGNVSLTAKKGETVELESSDAEVALATGYFEYVGEVENKATPLLTFLTSESEEMAVYADDTPEKLENRYNKTPLLELAAHVKAEATADNNKKEIAEKILKKIGEGE